MYHSSNIICLLVSGSFVCDADNIVIEVQKYFKTTKNNIAFQRVLALRGK